MNDYIEFLGIIDAIKTCIKTYDMKGALELLETAKELYNLKIEDFNQSEGH